VVLSGPSGVGKDALIARMHERVLPVAMPATMTTRAPREGERHGVHHLFVDAEGFDRAVAAGELLEHARVYGNRYGVPRSQVRQHLDSGVDVIVRVDIQGAEALREVLPAALFLFLVPDDEAHLEAHLRVRGAESEAQIALRLSEARAEIDRARSFATIVKNIEGDLDATVDRVAALMEAERTRVGREPVVV
jgi:guanylate kinase